MNTLETSPTYKQDTFSVNFYSDYNDVNNCHLNISVTSQENDINEIFNIIDFHNAIPDWTNVSSSISTSSNNNGIYDFTVNFLKDDTFTNFADFASPNIATSMPEIQNQNFYIFQI